MSFSQGIATKNHSITERALCWGRRRGKEWDESLRTASLKASGLQDVSLLSVCYGPKRQEPSGAWLYPAMHKTNTVDTVVAILPLVNWH